MDIGPWATLVGLDLRREHDLWRWTGIAIGDTVIFHIRLGRLARAFPVRRASAFGSRPDLVGANRTSVSKRAIRVSGRLADGDRVLIATDALAQFLLSEHESGRPRWEELTSAIGRPYGFRRWVDAARSAGLANDDTTLAAIETA